MGLTTTCQTPQQRCLLPAALNTAMGWITRPSYLAPDPLAMPVRALSRSRLLLASELRFPESLIAAQRSSVTARAACF